MWLFHSKLECELKIGHIFPIKIKYSNWSLLISGNNDWLLGFLGESEFCAANKKSPDSRQFSSSNNWKMNAYDSSVSDFVTGDLFFCFLFHQTQRKITRQWPVQLIFQLQVTKWTEKTKDDQLPLPTTYCFISPHSPLFSPLPLLNHITTSVHYLVTTLFSQRDKEKRRNFT